MPKSPATRPALNEKQIESTLKLRFMINSFDQLLTRKGIAGRLGKQFGNKRDLYDVLGYKKVLDVNDYWALYLRNGIAKRVVVAPVRATWRKPPEIVEKGSAEDVVTPFEKAFQELEAKLGLWKYLTRADRLAGIGQYGIMLIGTRGDLEMAIAEKAMKDLSDVFYLSTFSQRGAHVAEFVNDPKNPRFGLPVLYEVDLSGQIDAQVAQGFGTSGPKNQSPGVKKVHASRVIHLAEELLEDEVHGTPRLEPIFNRMYDEEKVAGGAGEMYWLGAYRGLILQAKEDFKSAFQGDDSLFTEQIDEFSHGMRRWLDADGYEVKALPTTDVHPKEVFDVLMAEVSAATGIPVRILLGSERGELASSQDEKNWLSFIDHRQTEYATPIIRDFIDRMISWGVLPEPANDYVVEWPRDKFTDMEAAQVASTFATAIKNVSPAGDTEAIISSDEFRVRFLGLPPRGDDAGRVTDVPRIPRPPVPTPAPRTAPARKAAANRGRS